MEPSNPTNGQPFIYRIMDAFGVKHQVVPVNHTHRDLVGQTVSIVINENEIELTLDELPNILRAISDPDSMPTANSDKLVTSGGVKAALDGKQGTLTFDTTPTAGSNNPVTSGGVKAALDNITSIRVYNAQASAKPLIEDLFGDSNLAKVDAGIINHTGADSSIADLLSLSSGHTLVLPDNAPSIPNGKMVVLHIYRLPTQGNFLIGVGDIYTIE